MNYRVNLYGIARTTVIEATSSGGAAALWAKRAPLAIWATTPEVRLEVRERASDEPECFLVRAKTTFEIEGTT